MKHTVYQRTLQKITGNIFFLLTNEEYQAKYGRKTPLLELPVRNELDVGCVRRRVDEYFRQRLSAWREPARRRVLLALSEAVTNVVKHTPAGKVMVHLNGEDPFFQIIDEGPGINLGILPCQIFSRGFSTAASLGAGFPVMLQYCRRLELYTSERGTKLALEFDLQSLMTGGESNCG